MRPMIVLVRRKMESVLPEARFALGQAWLPETEAAFRPGTIAVAWTAGALEIAAQLLDDDLVTTVSADNQRTWELGDVFEVFLQLAGRREYVEMHVTPNNFRLHSRLPGVRGEIRPGGPRLPLSDLLVQPPGFESLATTSPGEWRATLLIPPSVLGLPRWEQGVHLRASFCRYDAGPGRKPVLSSSSPHPVPSFHRPDEWAPLSLAI